MSKGVAPLVSACSGATVDTGSTDSKVADGHTDPVAAAAKSCTFPSKQATFKDDLNNTLVRGRCWFVHECM